MNSIQTVLEDRRGRNTSQLFLRNQPDGSEGKESVCDVGDPVPIPGSGRSPGAGNSNPFQYSCLKNPVEGRGWWATVHRITKSQA